ncbi:MAG: peptidase dimerization domain-containing protein [Geminicoccaceae bacterium]
MPAGSSPIWPRWPTGSPPKAPAAGGLHAAAHDHERPAGSGGSQINIVPGCTFEMEFRTLPEEDPKAHLDRVIEHVRHHLLPSMRAVAPEADIAFSTFLSYPGYRAPAGDAFVAAGVELAGGHAPRAGFLRYGSRLVSEI